MIQKRATHQRGCGWRTPGGLYMVAPVDGVFHCPALPFKLHRCPTCGHGIKFSRAWTWVDGAELAIEGGVDEAVASCSKPCRKGGCPLLSTDPVGLLWVGEQSYHRPGDFIREALDQGISRRLPHKPKGFVAGETIVFFAHKQCCPDMDSGKVFPGVFFVCRPAGFEYVVTGEETEEELKRMIDRGIQPVEDVRVEPIQQTIPGT